MPIDQETMADISTSAPRCAWSDVAERLAASVAEHNSEQKAAAVECRRWSRVACRVATAIREAAWDDDSDDVDEWLQPLHMSEPEPEPQESCMFPVLKPRVATVLSSKSSCGSTGIPSDSEDDGSLRVAPIASTSP
mmetsp:Transcript_57629/g.166874  ORF Transcript_57629/g.166874 Transcript_57629/m.166874 type:complete len:136 (-) Transcript_57629:121-528(-)